MPNVIMKVSAKKITSAYVESLYIEPAEDSHSDMYLKAIYLFKESGEYPAKVASISRILKISAPSVVQMLDKLDKRGVVKYSKRGAVLTAKGMKMARIFVRN